MPKRIPYGVANYEEIVRDNAYFVDKTAHIPLLENVRNPVFLRPRRFGKSLWCSVLQHYYDVRLADRFEALFGHTWIGQHPTPHHNRYLVLPLDFSVIQVEKDIAGIEHNFKKYCNDILRMLPLFYPEYMRGMPEMPMENAVAANLSSWFSFIRVTGAPSVYVIIDEYDSFVNQLIDMPHDHLFQQMTTGDSFLRAFFKVLKQGRQSGAVANVFVTGVLPITMDDLASGFNIASYITLDPKFENMLGFTQSEVDALLDAIYQDYVLDPATRGEVGEVIKSQYNGYHFINPEGEAVYNSTILMYFLDHLCHHREITEYLTDMNLRTDLAWVRRITGAQPGLTEAFVTQLTTENAIRYDRDFLVSKFNMRQFFDPSFFPISFFYLGMLTRRDMFEMRLPNLNMRKIFVEYFNELQNIDVSMRYTDVMRAFVAEPNLERLFTGYWELYVSQLPEALFAQMDENFYRTTFFELCSRYLSPWFTWNVERSYPQGRTDLEFVGKYHAQFAGLRWVIEFKYYSNAEFKRFGVPIAEFELQPSDTEQIAGYVTGLRQEYPEAQVRQYVIYCFGNQGFRVFEV